MSFDIYGNNLRSGHCEVHPHVHEEYPCSVCIDESNARKRAEDQLQREHDEFLDRQYEIDKLRAELEKERRRVKELERDAIRYQWLRNADNFPVDDTDTPRWDELSELSDKGFDDWIDSALSAGEGGE